MPTTRSGRPRPRAGLVGAPTWTGGFVVPVIDTTPPAAPQNLVASAAPNSGASLTWSANTNRISRDTTCTGRRPAPWQLTGSPLNGSLLASSSYTNSSIIAGTTYFYRVVAVDTSANPSVGSNEATTTLAGNYALQLNGSTQYSTLGSTTNLRASQFTLETWLRRAPGGVTQNTGTGGLDAYPLITKGRAEAETAAADVNYFFGIDAAGHLAADFEEAAGGATPSLNHPIAGASVIAADNTWHHAAATYDGTSWKLYLDGDLDGQLLVGQPANAATNVLTAIGTSMNTAGVAAGIFSGTIDEARIWNVARSQAQIQATKDVEIGTPTTGLLGEWRLNEGIGASLGDGSGNSVSGVTTGTPIWVAGFVPPTPNGAPTVALVGPSDGATGTAAAPQLSVTPTDPEGQPLTVTFFGRAYASGTFAQLATMPTSPSGTPAATAWSGRGDGQRYEWYVTVFDGSKTTTSPTWTFNTAPGADPVLVGAGDIAGCATSGDETTAAIVTGVQGGVFTLGDNAYDNGLITEFTNCYGPSWGVASIKSRTRPTSGNHDFGNDSNNGDGYFDFFDGVGASDGAAGPRNTGIYSYDIGSRWHVVVLNSECGHTGVGCTATSPQATWLKADLAAHADRNVIAMIHRPFISSGVSNGLSALSPLWSIFYDYGVDLVLSGHDHHYEVFDRMNANGTAVDATSGVREIIVGTGGFSETGTGTVKTGSLVRNFTTFGVLKLTLHQASYDWAFLPELGATFTDLGSSPVNDGANRSPAISSVSISPASPTTTQTLTATVTASDPDGDSLTTAYQWTKNGTDIAGATGSTLNLATVGNGDRGDVIRVRATVSDGIATSAPVTSSPTTIVNAAPTATVSLSPTGPTTNQTVTATATKADADGDPVGLTFVWSVGTTVVKTTPSSSGLTDSLDLSVAGNGDKGQLVSVAVTPSDGALSGTAASSSTTVANSAPGISVSLSPTTPGTGDILTATVSSPSDADGDLLTWTYVWTNGSTVIQTTSSSTSLTDSIDLSVAGNGDAGDTISVAVTANDGAADGTPATDTVGVENQSPVMDSVAITPASPTTNETMTALPVGHDPDGTTVTFSYQWTKNGSDIAGATASTLNLATVGSGDRGDVIRVSVSASDGALSSEPLTSSAVTIGNSSPTATVSLSPDPAGTDGIMTATATKSDPDTGDVVTLTYVWKVNGSPVRTQVTTSASDALDLSVTGNGDTGDTITVEVTPSDGAATGVPVTDTAAVTSTALTFNGSSQYVTFGPATGLDSPTFTLETWFRWTGGGVGTSTGSGGIANAIPLITKGRAEAETPANLNMNYFLGIDAASGKLVGDFEDTATGGNHPVTGNAVVTTNAWHHVAATYDGSTWRLYLDGVLDRSLVVGAFTPEATSIQHAAIGTAMTSAGLAAGFFAGSIDEARIWNVARTGAQIHAAKDNEITTAQAGLLGRWGLNEGSGTTAGNSAGSINGTLVASPTWIAGYGFPQDTSAPLTPAGLAGIGDDGAATLSWTANAETDIAGYDLYRSTTTPVDTSGTPLNGPTLVQATTYADSGLDQRHDLPLCPDRGRRLRQPLGCRRRPTSSFPRSPALSPSTAPASTSRSARRPGLGARPSPSRRGSRGPARESARAPALAASRARSRW